jgi:hypothetical protein
MVYILFIFNICSIIPPACIAAAMNIIAGMELALANLFTARGALKMKEAA